MRFTAIVVALNEAPFIGTVIRAIYPFVDRVFVQTGYDRGWNGNLVEPDGTLDDVLGIDDPDGKITILVRRIPDEAIARNTLMRMDGYKLDHRHRNSLGMDQAIGSFCRVSDYYWIIDGDEVYDPRSIGAILDYVRATRPRVLRVRGLTYFRSWNYVVDPSDDFFQPGFVEAGVLFRENRNLVGSRLWRVAFNKYTNPYVGKLRHRVMAGFGDNRLPESIGVFHHGAYVGDDSRILKKIRLSGHYEPRMEKWFENVWCKWNPSMKDLHPVHPEMFPGVRHVQNAELPPVIRDSVWPKGYLEPPHEADDRMRGGGGNG